MDSSARQGLTHQHPWDLNLVVVVVVVVLVTRSCLTLQPHGLQATGLLCPWDSADKNAIVDCHFLLQSSRLRLGKPLQSSEENF